MRKYLQSYRQRNIAIGVGFVVFLLLAYSLSFRKTLQLRRENVRLETQLSQAESLPARLTEARRQQAELGQSFQQEATQLLHLQLFETITAACEDQGASLYAFPDPTQFTYKEATVATWEVVLEGGFAALVNTLSALDLSLKGSRVMSVKFLQGQDRKTKRNFLRAHVYIQQIQTEVP
ncbi:MAG TPA: hypothetical protein DCE41_02955 [Cytophagales bacterium]|nr:hypothetical protein [Cytophagales bacterium]HAA19044.1 hypothetical protein [Cytophagales bacterium]